MENITKKKSSQLFLVTAIFLMIEAILLCITEYSTDYNNNKYMHGAILSAIASAVVCVLFIVAFVKNENQQMYLLTGCGVLAFADLAQLIWQIIGQDFHVSTRAHYYNYMGYTFKFKEGTPFFHANAAIPALIELLAYIAIFLLVLFVSLPKTQKIALKIFYVPSILSALVFVAGIILFNTLGGGAYTWIHGGYYITVAGIGKVIIQTVVLALTGAIVKQHVPKDIVDEARSKKAVKVVVQQGISKAGELVKYKELLDAGVITQEDFDAKKKELLGL